MTREQARYRLWQWLSRNELDINKTSDELRDIVRDIIRDIYDGSFDEGYDKGFRAAREIWGPLND